jgi:hypothetical protein
MRGMSVIAAAAIGFGAITAAAAADSNGRSADQPTPLTAPPLSGTTSSDLGRSGGVITPPDRCGSPNEADAVPFMRSHAGRSTTRNARRRPIGQTKVAPSARRTGALLIFCRRPDRLSSARWEVRGAR